MLERIRDFPETSTPEDSLRSLITDRHEKNPLQDALNHLYATIHADPEIAGVIGYSEGAGLAASLMFDEQRKLTRDGTVKRIKCGVFFTGWPPFTAEGEPVFADETDESIDPPTIHVVGANGEPHPGRLAGECMHSRN